jgi:hypothetical protein
MYFFSRKSFYLFLDTLKKQSLTKLYLCQKNKHKINISKQIN